MLKMVKYTLVINTKTTIMDDTVNSIGCLSILFTLIANLFGILFIFLKLVGAIHWSWWLVTLPLWGPWLIYLIITFILLVFIIYYDSKH